MKRALSLILVLALAVLTLAACADEHTHVYGDDWKTDADYHWHESTCEHEGLKSSVGEHVDDDENGACDICAYGTAHEHTFTDAWQTSTTQHWHAATCEGHSDVKISVGNHVDADENEECDICGYGDAHIHTFGDTWVTSEEKHWHAASCGCADVIASEGVHVDADGNEECDICGYGDAHIHSFGDTWQTSAEKHWHIATCTGHSDVKVAEGNHADVNGDGKCDVCSYVVDASVAGHTHTYTDVWSKDASGHWHGATCGHSDIKQVFTAHSDEDEDAVCDVCGFEITYTVSVNADYIVNVEESFVVKNAEDLTFTAFVSDKYVLVVNGAAQVGDAALENGIATYTYKVEAVKADATVTILAVRTNFVSDPITGSADADFGTEPDYWNNYSGSCSTTVNFPAAGDYVLLPTYKADVENNGIYIGDDYYMPGNTFSIWEAGETEITFNVATQNSDLSFTTVNFSIVAVPDEAVKLVTLTGEGIMLPEGIYLNAYFYAPAPGAYLITSATGDVKWDEYGSTSTVVVAKEAGEAVSLVINKDVDTGSFELKWTATLLDETTVSLGENNMTLTGGVYAPIVFTAPTTGLYTFTCANGASIKYYDEDINYFYYIEDQYLLEAGDEVVFYVSADVDGAEVVKVDFLGATTEMQEGYRYYDDTYYYYVDLTVSAEGYAQVIIPCTDGWYTLTAPWGAVMSLDGGETWVESAVIGFAEDENVSVILKNEALTEDYTDTIYLEEFDNSLEVKMGEATELELEPGITYYVYVTDAFNTTITMTTTNSYVSLSEDTIWGNEYYFEVTLNAEETQKATFITAYKYGNPIVEGDNTYDTWGNNMIVTLQPEEAGYYLITVGADTTLTYAGVEYDEGDFVEIELEANALFAAYVKGSPATVNLVRLGDAKPRGKFYNVNVSNVDGMYVISYTATEKGTYILAPLADETNAVVVALTVDNSNGFNAEYVSYVVGDTVIDGSNTTYKFALNKGETAYFMVTTLSGEADNIGLSIVKGPDSVKVVVENKVVTVPSYNNADIYSFTAIYAGEYTFAISDMTNIEAVYAGEGGWNSVPVESFPYTVELEAGETIYFAPMTQSAVDFDVTITVTTTMDEGAEYYTGYTVDSIVISADSNADYTFTAAEDGKYMFAIEDNTGLLVYSVNGDVETLITELQWYVELKAGDTYTIRVKDDASADKTVGIAYAKVNVAEKPKSFTFVVDYNSNMGYGDTSNVIEFTPETSGTYTFAFAEGTTSAIVTQVVSGEFMADWKADIISVGTPSYMMTEDVPVATMELEAGVTYYFNVATQDWSSATITFTISLN